MSKFSDDLDAEVTNVSGPKQCPVCVTLSGMTDGDALSLRVALRSALGSRTLSRILRKHDIKLGEQRIAQHRKERHGESV